MVTQVKDTWRCEICGYRYEDSPTPPATGREWAEKCEAWCREHKSCNLEIIAHGTPPSAA